MILIISSDFDESTFIVLKWLKKLKAGYLRINNFNESVASLLVALYEKKEAITSIWYRRKISFHAPSFTESDTLNKSFTYSLNQEVKTFNEYLYFSLQHAHWINHPDRASVNKLIVLEKAKAMGLNVASFIVTNKKEVLRAFQQQHGQIIAKPLSNINPITYKEERFIPYTRILQAGALAGLPDTFFLSFFQAYIPKQFEIRSFFLDGVFYSMAIMSQQNQKTQEDFRNYDFDNPNRFLPYQLPEDIEAKLTLLMETLGLNSGSLDIIKSTDGQFYFLEVNPVGQFGMVSYPCNYYLEKIIAQKLIDNESNN